MLDAVVDYLPSPVDVPPIVGISPKDGSAVTVVPDEKAPLAAMAFKVATDPFVGQLIFIRVYSGVLSAGSYIYNSTSGQQERIGRVLRMKANDREEIKDIFAGGIAAAVGLANGRPVHFLSVSNNYWWTTATIQIPADQRSKIVDIARAHLKQGEVICNFIEGQRNHTGTLLPGKTGTVRMATAAGVPVVPLGITCSAGRNMGQSLLFLVTPRHTVSIAIGQPMRFTEPPGGATKEWLDQATRRLMEAIAILSGKKL
jgi:hypothetical protein